MKEYSKVAVIGLGTMGLPIALNLSKKSISIQVWNRSEPSRVVALANGIQVIEKLTDINAQIFLTVLPDIAQLNEVLKNGLQTALRPGDILVVMGTVSPRAVRALGARLEPLGIHVVDAPVSGGDVGAQEGTLSIMVGADPEDFKILLPILEAIGAVVRLMGPLGSGQIAKACNQIVVATTLSAIGEAVTLARKAGLDVATLFEILAGGLANSRALEVKGDRILYGNFTPGGTSANQLKDLKIALETSADSGVRVPVTERVAELFASMIASGDGALDHSAIIREIERMSAQK